MRGLGLGRTPLSLSLVALAACALPLTAQAAEDTPDLFELSLEELVQFSISTASRQTERLQDAPATAIVLTGDELRQRGYRELSEIYNDLPGMDLSRPYGDTYFRNQWRGLRKTIGTPYLLMLDGTILNHLYFNQDEVISTLPLSHIERVEIVYGPASAVYGPNAFVGVINVITRQDRLVDGYSLTGQLTGGSFDGRIADFHYLYKEGDWRFSLAGRLDDGELDTSQAGNYEWTKEHYQQDRSLWGAFADDHSRGGKYSSPHANRALDMRVFHKDTEFALQYFSLNTHFGTVYPSDRVAMLSYWAEPDLSVYLRQPWHFGERLSATLLLRYRQSGLDNYSDTLEAYNVTDPVTGEPVRVANYSYWAAENQSWALNLDGEYRLGENWNLLGGLKYESKDLQKAYRINFGPDMPVSEILEIDDYPNPSRPNGDSIPRNRIDTRDAALYAMLRYTHGELFGWNESHRLLAGVRFDHNSEYGTARTLRGGYVLSLKPWTAKLLYGEAFNEPAPRELYGGWRGSGSDPSLDPETSRTLETSLGYQAGDYSLLLSAYRLRSQGDIITYSGGARNLGGRQIQGLDLHLNARLPWGERPWNLWAYYSHIRARESRPQADGRLVEGPVGDTAPNSLHLGLTWPMSASFSSTLRARYVAARRTVPTNPVKEVPAYTVFDLNLLHRDWPIRGLGWSLSVLNLTDKDYFHPGLREANAGTAPGFRDEDGQWQGSAGYYNSLLPQEGRGLYLSLRVDF
ncbi:MAG: TonB-dependent receptor [Gammaproteobacteria bacterium]|nr:TonB-dependent receptor [Gammaproteobacteria bacterium]